MPSTADLVAGACLSAAFVALIVAAEAWRSVASPPAEHTRKLVHFGGGLVALAIPFVIRSHWVVLAMAAALGAVFLGSRMLGKLPSLHAVERRTRGVEYYPIAVYFLFVVAHEQPWKYVICLLVLAVGDAMAALVGKRFGRLKYEVDGNQKSFEGSAAFFLVTLAVVAVPLAAWPDPSLPPTVNCLLVALLAAALATGFEAVALDGRDNLWLPLGVYVVLTKLLRQPQEELIAQNLAFAAIGAMIAAAVYLVPALNVGATLVFVLATYGAWSLGSPDWAWPAATGMMLYLAVRAFGGTRQIVRSRRITRRLLLPFLVLVTANIAWTGDRFDLYAWLYGPYLAGCLAAAVVGSGIALGSRDERHSASSCVAMLIVSLVAASVMVGPAFFLQTVVAPTSAFVVVFAGAIVAQIFALAAPRDEETAEKRSIWTHALAAASMAIVALAQWSGVSSPWNPR